MLPAVAETMNPLTKLEMVLLLRHKTTSNKGMPVFHYALVYNLNFQFFFFFFSNFKNFQKQVSTDFELITENSIFIMIRVRCDVCRPKMNRGQ